MYQNTFWSVESELQDRWLQEERPVDNRIAIIAIEDESLGDLGQWPWDRRTHAMLLHMLAEGKPAVIGMDIIFQLAANDPDEDANLIEAVAETGNTILASYGLFDTYSKDGAVVAEALTEPFLALEESAAGIGHLNTFPDPDGVIRRSLLSFTYEEETIDSFAWVIANHYLEKQGVVLDKANLPLDAFNRFHIAYAGKPQQFEAIPYTAVLNGDVPADYFEDRIVLIGTYTPSIKDEYFTPLDGNQPMYGVEIHANIIQSILEGHYKAPLSWQMNLLLLLVIAGIAYGLCRIRSTLWSSVLILTLAAICLMTAKLLYTNGIIISIIYALILIVSFYAATVIFRYGAEYAERKRVTDIFGRYVAPQVVEQILKSGEEGLKLGGSRKQLTVLFVDIRGFTPLSEQVEPEELVGLLNEYLNLTADCIFRFGGTLDKFIGDAAMAIFNAPLPQEDHTMQAVKAAWEMKQGAAELENRLLERYGRKVSFGIGIHYGDAIVGNIGSKTRMDYTAIGDTVNTAARLESRAEPGQVLISEAVYEQVKERIAVKPLGEIVVKGKEQAVAVYELEGIKK